MFFALMIQQGSWWNLLPISMLLILKVSGTIVGIKVMSNNGDLSNYNLKTHNLCVEIWRKMEILEWMAQLMESL